MPDIQVPAIWHDLHAIRLTAHITEGDVADVLAHSLSRHIPQAARRRAGAVAKHHGAKSCELSHMRAPRDRGGESVLCEHGATNPACWGRRFLPVQRGARTSPAHGHIA